MILLLIVIIVLLLLLIGWQSYSKFKIKKNLRELSQQLDSILHEQSAEKVLFITNEETVQTALIQINRLLDFNQKIIADYSKTKESLRKMISNMSHDLKTPLTVILGYVEKLMMDKMMQKEERTIVTHQLYKKTEQVIELIHRFFDLVKLESGDYSIPLTKVSVSEICRKNVLEFYHLLQSKKLQVELDIPEQDYFILGNEEALNRVLSNLISNALRYGSEGGIIGLTVREEADNIAIDVWDQGKGIAEKEQELVFERLYTLDDARNPEFQGSGLGLSITKRLVEGMKGSIFLKSKPYEKTVFTCVFNRITY